MAVAPFQITSPLINISPNVTIFSAGTTGNQTANTQYGNIRIAAAGTTVTVTNSLCTTTSIIWACVSTADANSTAIKCVVPGNGSFVITLSTAPAAEVSISWGILS